MFSLWQRLNALATFSILLLAALSCAASFLDAFNSPSVRAHAEVIKVNRFRKQLTGNDEIWRRAKQSELDPNGKLVEVIYMKHSYRLTENGQRVKVILTLNISMDLQSLFTWNTKQVFVFLAAEYETSKNSVNQISLWDHIVPDKDDANFRVRVPTKYPLIDQGNNLRGRKIDLVLHWHVMPKTGRMIRDKMAISEFYLPDAYT